MPALQQLVLNGNQLSGSLPLSWGAGGSLGALQRLDLRRNVVSGQLPDTWCGESESFPSLQVGP